MIYSALIFDLDGTAIPSQMDGMPSIKVIASVAKARETVKVSVATGRTFPMCAKIISALQIVSPCVVSGGTQIIDPNSGKIIWEQTLSQSQSAKVVQIAEKYGIQCGFDGAYFGNINNSTAINGTEKIFVMVGISKELSSKIETELETVENIAVSTLPSWTSGIDIHVVHELGTKKHGIQKLMEIEKINKEELLVAGDGNNDLPLFESAGFKIAMGNAGEKLKLAADIIAPSVSEDGLAWAIDKYILTNN